MNCVLGRKPIRNNNIADKSKPEILPVTKLRFSRQQLERLNYYFSKENQNEIENPPTQAETIVERLTQRLICAVGNLDERFSSKFFISLNDGQHNTNLEYLIRLDALSSPVLYSDDSKPSCEILECEGILAGYARIRLRNKTATKWTEFINSAGFLRRDKIQERFVELLALAAAGTWPASPLDVDESILCAAPGKILDAASLHKILHIQPEQHMYYGAAINNIRFPDPRDFRLAIVDEPGGVRLRVGFLSPSFIGQDVEVRLLIGIGVDGWPQSSNFPGRISLGHSECLLYYRAAETGMYLVASGGTGVQSANWQLELPAAEITLLNHYGPTSAVSVVQKLLNNNQLLSHHNNEKCLNQQFTNKLITKRSLRESFWTYLEDDHSTPLQVLQNWTTSQISLHILKFFDKLINSLRHQFHASYFFSQNNLFLNPGTLSDEDYLIEANRVHTYLVKLHDISLSRIDKELEFEKMRMYEQLDEELVRKWSEVVNGLAPPAGTRNSRFSLAGGRRKELAYTQYTHRQLDYIGLLLKSMLKVKQYTVQFASGLYEDEDIFIPEDPLEDLIYLLVTIIDQARNHSTYPLKSKYRTKTQTQYDLACSKLIESIRKDKHKNFNFQDDNSLVKLVLRWLYKGLETKHSLAPVLRPFLAKLFLSSHEQSWFLETMQNVQVEEEIKGLGQFARLVNLEELTPALGLVDAVEKRWHWAKDVMKLVEKSQIRIVFCPDRGKVSRHILSLPKYGGNEVRTVQPGDFKTEKRFYTYFRGGGGEQLSSHSLNRNSVISHLELKQVSPLTETLKLTHRQGLHRCSGDLVQALISHNKISVLQELSLILPPADRQEILGTIHYLYKKENKRQVALRRHNTLPPIAPVNQVTIFGKSHRKLSVPQTYTPKLESPDAVKTNSLNLKQQKVLRQRERVLEQKLNNDTLIGTCRAARIKEDNKIMIFQDQFHVKGLFRNMNHNV